MISDFLKFVRCTSACVCENLVRFCTSNAGPHEGALYAYGLFKRFLKVTVRKLVQYFALFVIARCDQ